MINIKQFSKDKLVCFFQFLLCSVFYFYQIKAPLWICALASLSISLVFVLKVFGNEREYKNAHKATTCKFSIYSIVLFCPVMMNADGEMGLGIPFFALSAVCALHALARRWHSLGATLSDVTFPAASLALLLCLSNKWFSLISLSIFLGWGSYSSKENG